MKVCYDCNHCEVCRWIDKFKDIDICELHKRADGTESEGYKMKYEFVLTEQMENDRKNCGEDACCLECSCHMGEDDCIFNHLYVTAEQESEDKR